VFLIAHMGFAAAPAAAAVSWWRESRGFSRDVPDLRWLLLGSVLPDLVDKPLGQALLRAHFQNGRIYFHTFLFTILFLLGGVYRWRRNGDDRLLWLACGMAAHLVLDRIWVEPTTAFWPSLGPFLRHPSLGTIMEQVMEYLREPVFWAEEMGGALLLVASFRLLGVRSLRELGAFARDGHLPALATDLANGGRG